MMERMSFHNSIFFDEIMIELSKREETYTESKILCNPRKTSNITKAVLS